MKYWWVAALSIIGDRVTKIWVLQVLRNLPGGRMECIPGFLGFTYAENTGMAFGLLSNMSWLLTVLAIVVVVLLVLMLLRDKTATTGQRIATQLILGGALGNLIDRFLHGFVVDFIEFQFVNFAIFNVADMCVVVGVGLMLLTVLLADKRKAEINARDSQG